MTKPNSVISSSPKKKVKKVSLEDRIFHELDKMEDKPAMDENDYFGKSVAEQLKKLDPLQQSYTRLQISQVFKKYI